MNAEKDYSVIAGHLNVFLDSHGSNVNDAAYQISEQIHGQERREPAAAVREAFPYLKDDHETNVMHMVSFGFFYYTSIFSVTFFYCL